MPLVDSYVTASAVDMSAARRTGYETVTCKGWTGVEKCLRSLACMTSLRGRDGTAPALGVCDYLATRGDLQIRVQNSRRKRKTSYKLQENAARSFKKRWGISSRSPNVTPVRESKNENQNYLGRSGHNKIEDAKRREKKDKRGKVHTKDGRPAVPYL